MFCVECMIMLLMTCSFHQTISSAVQMEIVNGFGADTHLFEYVCVGVV